MAGHVTRDSNYVGLYFRNLEARLLKAYLNDKLQLLQMALVWQW